MMNIPVDTRMSRYVNLATKEVVVMMNTVDDITVGDVKFVKEDTFLKRNRDKEIAKPAVPVTPTAKHIGGPVHQTNLKNEKV